MTFDALVAPIDDLTYLSGMDSLPPVDCVSVLAAARNNGLRHSDIQNHIKKGRLAAYDFENYPYRRVSLGELANLLKDLELPDGWVTQAQAAKECKFPLQQISHLVALGHLATLPAPLSDKRLVNIKEVKAIQKVRSAGIYMSQKQAAQRLGVTCGAISDRIVRGTLKGQKVPGKAYPMLLKCDVETAMAAKAAKS